MSLRIKEIMRKESELIVIALDDLVYGTFEADWATLDTKRKEELILEGLYRADCAAPRDNSRTSCPEMTISGLAGDGEFNLIRMLKRLIDHDPPRNGRVKSLFLFAHPYVDHEDRYSNAAPDLLKRSCITARSSENFTTETLFGILEAYHDRPAIPVTPCEPPLVRNDKQRQDRRRFNTLFKSLGFMSTNLDATRKPQSRCSVLYLPPLDQAPDRPQVLRTLPPRSLLFEFCGVRRFDPSLLTPTTETLEFIGCPATIDNYRRTPALWRQIHAFSKADSQTQGPYPYA
ncbi:hypothetical protein B0H19DRAFT_1064303 [Mycena capillaripes]|nr:hypothetical protein B0H19DRAFT_1064303 [Mycena capillaripes]